MAKAVARICQDIVMNPERKFIRLQEIGLAHFLAWPVAMMIAVMLGLNTFAQLGIISILLCTSGMVFLSLGDIGRRELADQRETKNKGVR